jgi:hypothetical protein
MREVVVIVGKLDDVMEVIVDCSEAVAGYPEKMRRGTV